ncbi:MAG TPA: FG-GAP-like repeat-containing protein, partial [Puia sp.]|nr:FG-GAP-like repeat-containing protein [Puia sp.]
MPKLLPPVNAIACLLILSIHTIAQPVIDHFSPASGPAGSNLVITGSGFSPSATANTVFVGGAKATVTAASATSLTVTIPTGATCQPITVTTAGLQARSALSFILTYPAGNPQLYPSAFAAPQDQTTLAQDGPQSTLAADIDGDGRPDIVDTRYGTQLFTIYRNASTKGGQNGPAAGFAGPAYFDPGINLNMPLGKYTYATAIGDLDGDGKPDVIITNQTEATISIFHNTSSPAALSFDPSFAVPCGVVSAPHLAIGDLDGDGKPEVVLAAGSKLVILKNNSTPGTIQLDSATSVDLPYLTDIAINDFDGDGKADIYTSYAGGTLASGLLFLLNTSSPGNFSFTAQPKMDVLIDGVKPLIGDMDGDGRPDLGLTSYSIPAISLFQNTSTPGHISFTALPNIKTADQTISLNLGDLDGDGLPELAALVQPIDYSKPDTVVILKNKSTAGNIAYLPTRQLVAKTSTTSVLLADLDGDGKPDIITAQRTPPTALTVFRNRDNEPYIRTFLPATAFSGSTVTLSGVSFTGATALSFGGVPAASFTVVNDSTVTATIASGGASGNVLVTTQYGSFSLPGFEWKTAATPVITSFTPTSAPAGASITITGSNFDPTAANNTAFFGGMKATVTAASATSLTVTVPAGTTYSHLSVTTNHLTAWSKAFFTLSFSGVVNANASTSFAQELDFPNGFQSYNLTMDEVWTGDLDGDGRPDVLARASNDQLAIYRNTGKADTAMLNVTVNSLQMFVNDFAIADLDGDGKQDIVYCAQDYGAAWYTNISTPGTIKFTAAGHPTDRAPFFMYEHVKI